MDKILALQSFWRGKKVFITGHTGFKGSWLTYILSELGAEIKGYSLPLEEDKVLFKGLKLVERINSVYGNINNHEHIKQEIKTFNPEIIFHLAAQPLVRRSYNDPRETFETNILGTFNVLESALISNNLKSIVIVTSDKCYHNKEWDYSYRENDQLGGYDPYSASKACTEIIAQSMRSSYYSSEIGFSTVRAGNVIGGGDFSMDRLFPDIAKSISNKNRLIIRNPLATRPWQHVIEPLFAYMELAKNQFKDPVKFSSEWNIGPHSENAKSVESILRIIEATFPNLINWQYDNNYQPHEAQSLKLDSSKFMNKNDWAPKWDLKMTIHRTISWYTEFHKGRDITELCKEDLIEYIR
jgi:CDP-glucose 4,6-dehydratase